MKKIYLASSFSLKTKVEAVARELKKNGFEITVEWWHKDYKEYDVKDSEWYNLDIVKQIKLRNFKGIDDADALVLVAGVNPKKFNGANIIDIKKMKTKLSINFCAD